MEAYNKEQFYENFAAICKMRGIKISSVEQALGLSQGYFSRLRKNINSPGLDTAAAVAAYLNVSIDSLTYGNCVHLTNKDDMIMQITTILKRQTSNDEISWIDEDPDYLLMRVSAGCFHPLVRPENKYTIDEETGETELEPGAGYFSYVYRDESPSRMQGKIYHYQFPGTNFKLYLSHIVHLCSMDGDEYGNNIHYENDEEISYELYIFAENPNCSYECKAYCGSALVAPEVGESISSLYKEVDSSCDSIRLEKDAWNVCLDYLIRNRTHFDGEN